MRGWRDPVPALAAVLALLLLGPALGPGYVLSYDMVFVPRQDLLPAAVGLGGQLPRAVPQDAVLALLTLLAPGAVWQHLALAGLVAGGAWGAARLLRGQSTLVRLAAGSLFVWSPYLVERLVLGSWSLLVAVAVLPWALSAAIGVRRGTPGSGSRVLLLTGLAALTPTGGLLVLVVAVPVAVLPGSVLAPLRRTGLLAAAALLQAPWVVPAVIHPAVGQSDLAGVGVFALRPEGAWGSLVTALGTGGAWNAEVVPASRATVVAPLAALVLTALTVAGLRPLRRVLGLAATTWLAGAAVLGLGIAVLGSLDATAPWVGEIITRVPGAGLLRDGQKLLAPWLLLVAVGAPLGLARALEPVRDRAVAGALASALVLAPFVVMPDAVWGGLGRLDAVEEPAGWGEVRTFLESDAAATGDVVVLPWSAFRAFGWNAGRTSLDPAPRWLPRTSVVDATLVVAGGDGELIRVSGEDPRAVVVADALAEGTPLRSVVPQLGVAWVVVEHDTPGPPLGDALEGMTRILRSPDADLWAVGVPASPPTPVPPWKVALVGAAYAAAAAVLAGALLSLVARWRGWRRRGRALATLWSTKS